MPQIPTPAGIPLAVFGGVGWILALLTLSYREATGRTFAIIFAALCWVFLLYAWVTARAFCPWCTLHAISVTVYSLTLSAQLRSSWIAFLIGLLFATGLTAVTPRSVGRQELSHELSNIAPGELERASVEMLKGEPNSPTVYALIDLNCGHCVEWLNRVLSEPRTALKSLRVVFGTVVKLSDANDSNLIGDALVDHPDHFNAFLRRGAAGNFPNSPQAPSSRRHTTNKLYAQLKLKRVPVFFLDSQPGRILASAAAYDELFVR